MNHIVAARQLLNAQLDWYAPFPMGVFGTLREGQWNNHRMHVGKVQAYHKAFLPHFIAHGLSISFKQNSSAPFEVFFYEPEEWKKMIGGVDALEGFRPERTRRSYGYHRTLAWLHLLPDDFSHNLFRKPRFAGDMDEGRDLQIPLAEWQQYERVPCWVYSSVRQNEAAAKKDVVIWDGP